MTQTASKPFLIGISGGAASGKAEACKKIKDVLYRKAKGKKVEVLSLSSFYRELSDEELKLALNSEFDFDHPNSFDFRYLADVLRKIKQGEHVVLHKYDCSAYSSTPDVQEVPDDVDVVIVEGILTFYQKEVRDMFDLKIFIESDADTRLCRKGIFKKR
ncbi:Uridine-cytidine kinase 2, variant 2 [Schistosoma haematobium]|uniref:Uridine-cytidine kinase 2, variant 2 n=1 Tax=Schistosoma haematobium TaxID=6185 RepID=A0A922LIJ1_SCHHA|nr:Uridine-cytidine kinase 2, variant 2 [Schistosoma haematobium]KAH9585814.1 Uridine-cytidine kinase 2, variant 2 [Schistosoma haematobium]